jgi:hypothetical protein
VQDTATELQERVVERDEDAQGERTRARLEVHAGRVRRRQQRGRHALRRWVRRCSCCISVIGGIGCEHRVGKNSSGIRLTVDVSIGAVLDDAAACRRSHGSSGSGRGHGSSGSRRRRRSEKQAAGRTEKGEKAGLVLHARGALSAYGSSECGDGGRRHTSSLKNRNVQNAFSRGRGCSRKKHVRISIGERSDYRW